MSTRQCTGPANKQLGLQVLLNPVEVHVLSGVNPLHSFVTADDQLGLQVLLDPVGVPVYSGVSAWVGYHKEGRTYSPSKVLPNAVQGFTLLH
jgi:hypothetical protein